MLAFDARSMTVDSLAEDLTPLVRRSMPKLAATLVWPILGLVIRIVLWVLIRRYGSVVGPLISAVLPVIGSALRQEVREWLESFEKMMRPFPADMPASVREAYIPPVQVSATKVFTRPGDALSPDIGFRNSASNSLQADGESMVAAIGVTKIGLSKPGDPGK